MPTDCIFCKIAAQEIKVPLVHEDADIVAFRDNNPQAPTHLLVVPRRHVRDLSELAERSDPADQALLGRLLQIAATLARSEGLEAGFRVVINTGPDGGQTVHHLHLHVLGGRSLHWPPG